MNGVFGMNIKFSGPLERLKFDLNRLALNLCRKEGGRKYSE